MSDKSGGFFEEDEPSDKIRAAFERGEKGLTAKRPRDLNQLAKSITEEATDMSLAVVISLEDVKIEDNEFKATEQSEVEYVS
jgi:hypothetical protein